MATRSRKKTEEAPEAPETSSEVEDVIGEMMKGGGHFLSDSSLSIHLPGVIPTGSEWLDHAIGRGGWPCGRASLLAGDEGSGKTTLALQACANAQRAGGIAVYFDAEFKLDRDYARSLGVNVDRLIISAPDSMEEAFEEMQAKTLIFNKHRVGTHVPLLFVFDSLNAFVTQQELEGKDTPGTQARAMSLGLKKMMGPLSKGRATLLMISQVRHKIGVMYGSTKSTAAGNAPRFYSTVVAILDPKNAVKEGEVKVGREVDVEIQKNQIAAPFQRCRFVVRYGSGIDYAHSMHEALIAAGIVSKGPATDGDSIRARRFRSRDPEEEDDEGEEDARPKSAKKGGGGSGWVTWDPGDGREAIRWQGPSGLRARISDDRETFRELRHALRERYGWGD